MFVRVRNLFPEHSQAWEIVNCPLCFAVWSSLFFVAVAMFLTATPILWVVLLYPGAIGIAYALLGLAAMIQ